MSDLPLRIYTPDSPLREPCRFLREGWADLVKSRELAWRLTLRDFKALYRQSFAGYLWAFLPPLFASLTFIVLQSGGVVSFGETAIPYPAFVLIGTILWQMFVDSMNNPLRMMQASRQLLTKINFPREALILSAIFTSLVNVGIRLLILIPVLLWFRFPFTPTMFLFPAGVIGLVLLGVTIGLFLSTVSMLYDDLQRGLLMVTSLWMFFTPVVFPAAQDGVAGWIMAFNPVSPVLTTARDWISGVPPSHVHGFLTVSLLVMVGLVASWLVYRLVLPRVVERLGM